MRFQRTGRAVPIAAGILLDIFNVFLLALDLFGGRREGERPRPGVVPLARGNTVATSAASDASVSSGFSDGSDGLAPFARI
jgi:hypothetical protein